MSNYKSRARLAVGAAMLIPLCAFAAPETDTVVVTATRLPESSFEVPASIDVISGDRFRNDTLAVNLSEGLSGVAGLSARDRQHYAQDTQISVRGFGTRASFGIRGVRMFAGSIPASPPAGKGQLRPGGG